MTSKDPFDHLDELIDRAARLEQSRQEDRQRFEGRIEELEQEVAELRQALGKQEGGKKKVDELSARIQELETQRDQTRDRLDKAIGRLRDLLGEASGETPADDEG